MQINFQTFTPMSALIGGALIGTSAATLLLIHGRIAGISGILGGLLQGAADKAWRIAFVLGLLAAPLAWRSMADLPISQIDTDWPLLILAGLVVGIGTRYGAGCTSGHGVCGVARLSPRSLVATLAFMTAGFVTVFLLRHRLAG